MPSLSCSLAAPAGHCRCGRRHSPPLPPPPSGGAPARARTRSPPSPGLPGASGTRASSGEESAPARWRIILNKGKTSAALRFGPRVSSESRCGPRQPAP
eukprot:1178200-Prorocentrum_minimum.AAC.1